MKNKRIAFCTASAWPARCLFLFITLMLLAALMLSADAAELPEVCYPTSIQCSEDKTELKKIYDLTPEADPKGIARSDFEKDGYHYTLVELLRQELPEDESREHTETVSLQSAKKDMESVLAILPQEKEFITEDGLMGTLTLRLDTVQVEPSGYGSSTKEISAKRSYPNLSEQDTQYIPKSIEDNGKTLTLSDIQWQTDNTANMDGYAVADRFTAIATYTGSATSSYVKGYTVTADYRWNQEVSPNSSKEQVDAAREFSQLKIGYRGDLAFKDAEIIDVPQFVCCGAVRKLPALTESELRHNLGEKLKECWDTYKSSLLTLSAEELIKRAEEIAAMQVCYSELRCIESDLDRDLCSFLLQRDDPLSALSEAWMAHQNVDVGETFQSLLDDLYRDGSNQVQEPAHQTVKELLETYPHDSFQLMTPSGFVDLTPNETEILLRGEAAMAHPGTFGYELPVPAEEILELEIETLKQGEDGRWYALVDMPAPQMDVSEQGLQMNL